MRRSGLCEFKTIIGAILVLIVISVIATWMADSDQHNSRYAHLHRLSAAAKLLRPQQLFQSKSTELKDWHDHNAIAKQMSQQGLGEGGKPAHLTNFNNAKYKELVNQNGFNGLLSDNISLNRSVPDIRHPECKNKKYLSQLPQVSIVIPFFNEHWSTLLRSCFSILSRTPPELLKEIILVDDCSTKDFLGTKLDQYVEQFVPKTQIVRLPKRSGLIKARIAGAKLATAEVLVFFDSHIETNYNWLPPLLDPIARNPKTCVCPFIDVIDHDTFHYRAQDEGARGAFDWQFYYKRLPLLKEDLIDKTKPFRSPVMAGGLFAIGTEFFWELGGYDEGLDIWGGEQYELSFKIWMCGGEMVDAPCSRVGHIYRGPGGHLGNTRTDDYVHKNYKRVAEVWMDEYKEYLYRRDPERYRKIDAGDLTQLKALREKLQCKSFKWFMEEIAFDLPKKYPPIEPPDYATGAIQSLAATDLCLDTLNHGTNKEVGLYPCSDDFIWPHDTQYWKLSWHKDLRTRRNNYCLDVSKSSRNAPAVLYECHLQQGNQLWRYDLKKKWLIQGKNRRCLEANAKTKKVYVNDCDPDNKSMKWAFGNINKDAFDSYDDDKADESDGL